MNVNKWTLGLAAAGVIGFGAIAQAEEASEHVATAVSGTQISGYVSTSAQWMVGTGRGVAGAFTGRSFVDNYQKQDGFNLDVIDLTLSKSLDEGEWAAGYKGELWFGPDANAFGANSAVGAGNATDLAIRQAYVELRAPVGNGIDFKVGVFDTPIGYEVTNHDSNPNFGRSYGWGIEPTTHTGILASYKVADFLSVTAGVANQGVNSNQINLKPVVESDKSYIAAFTLTAPSDWGFLSGASLTAGAIDSTISGVAGFGNKADLMNYYVGVALPLPIEGWSVGAAWDYRGQSKDAANASNYANAVALYLSAKATDKLKVNLRADYTTASGGTYYAVAGDLTSNNSLFAVTTTLDYSLWANVISRLEVRWDHQMSGGFLDANGGVDGGVFGNNDKNAITVAANLIYKF
jgi:hypothetical protein